MFAFNTNEFDKVCHMGKNVFGSKDGNMATQETFWIRVDSLLMDRSKAELLALISQYCKLEIYCIIEKCAMVIFLFIWMGRSSSINPASTSLQEHQADQ